MFAGNFVVGQATATAYRGSERQLGHSSATTTETYYAHLIEESRVQASECIADVMLRRAVPSDATPQPTSSSVDNQRSL